MSSSVFENCASGIISTATAFADDKRLSPVNADDKYVFAASCMASHRVCAHVAVYLTGDMFQQTEHLAQCRSFKRPWKAYLERNQNRLNVFSCARQKLFQDDADVSLHTAPIGVRRRPRVGSHCRSGIDTLENTRQLSKGHCEEFVLVSVSAQEAAYWAPVHWWCGVVACVEAFQG